MKIETQPQQPQQSQQVQARSGGIWERGNTGPGRSRSGGGEDGGNVELIDTDQNSQQRIFMSLSILVRGKPQFDIGTALAQVMDALTAVLTEVESNKIKFSQQEMNSRLEAKLEKLEQADKKLRRAMRKDKGNKAWNAVKLSFNFASALGTLILGAMIVAGTTGFCHVGWAMIGSGSFQFILAADALTAELTGGYGIAGSLHLLFGGSKKEAAHADLAFRISLTVCILVCAAVAFFADPVSTSSVAAQRAIEAKAIVSIAQGLMGISTAAGDVYFAVRKFEAADLTRDSKFLRADGHDLDALIAALSDLVDAAIAYLRNFMNTNSEILGTISNTNRDISRSLARAKMTA